MQVRKLPTYCRASGDTLPSLIKLLGEVEAWLPLLDAAKAAFAVFLLAIMAKAGEATWENTMEWLKNEKKAKPLIDVVASLEIAAKSIDGEVQIGVGLNVPDNNFGTAFWVNSRDPVKMTKVLATFIVRRDEVSQMMQAEVEHGREPLA